MRARQEAGGRRQENYNLILKTDLVLMSVEPAIAALVGFVLLGEKLAARTIIAIAMVTVAAIGSTLSTKES